MYIYIYILICSKFLYNAGLFYMVNKCYTTTIIIKLPNFGTIPSYFKQTYDTSSSPSTPSIITHYTTLSLI